MKIPANSPFARALGVLFVAWGGCVTLLAYLIREIYLSPAVAVGGPLLISVGAWYVAEAPGFPASVEDHTPLGDTLVLGGVVVSLIYAVALGFAG